jgi:Leucine-rich repeat (LRR) protein
VVQADEVENFHESLKNFPLVLWKENTFDCHHFLHLTISNSSISSIHFLNSLVSLEYLNLSFNQITDIHPLSALVCLKVLDISHNKIIDISPLQNTFQLRIFRFHKNLIESLDPIRECTQLVELWISRNQVEVFELFSLLLLKNLQHIFVEGNPLESKPKHLEFLLAISPGLSSINGVPVQSIFPPLSSRNHPLEFFRTVDGRQMLTQARSRMTDSQREFLLRYQHFPSKTMTTSNVQENSLTNSSQIVPQEVQAESFITLKSENKNGKIKYFKAKKKHNLPKKFISSESNSIEDQNFQSPETTFNPESAKTVIRFGDASTSPVALVLENNGAGYARYVYEIMSLKNALGGEKMAQLLALLMANDSFRPIETGESLSFLTLLEMVR